MSFFSFLIFDSPPGTEDTPLMGHSLVPNIDINSMIRLGTDGLPTVTTDEVESYFAPELERIGKLNSAD